MAESREGWVPGDRDEKEFKQLTSLGRGKRGFIIQNNVCLTFRYRVEPSYFKPLG